MEAVAQLFSNIAAVFKTVQAKDVIDILVITFIIFSLFKLVRQTRAEQLLKGVVVLLVLYLFSSLFQLTMLTSLLKTFFEFAVILVAIIFQPEIRKALEQIGRSKVSRKYLGFLQNRSKSDEEIRQVRKAISDVADTAVLFSRSKTGALIVFERYTMLSDIASSGTILNSQTSVALLGNIFFNKAPLHDGASIIRDGLLYAAGCILPLTDNKSIDPNLGTRHRAALGISEQSDAVVLVVSEETGVISLAVEGVLTRNYTRDTLIEKLEDYLIDEEDNKKDSSFFSFKRKEKIKNEENK